LNRWYWVVVEWQLKITHAKLVADQGGERNC